MAVRAAFTSFFCMSWLALRDHRHGCPLDHLQTLRNIAWYAALSLRRQHKTPSIISDVRWGGTRFTHKNRHEPLRGSTSRMSLTLHIGLPIDIIWRTHAPHVACYLFYKCCHLPRNKTLAEYRSYNLGNLTIEYTARCAGAHRTVTYREYYTRCCINTIWPPDDEHRVARNM